MTINQIIPWESLETRSASLLLLAGLIQLVNVTLQVLPRVSDLAVPELVRDLILVSAGIVALVGLLGLVPRLKKDVPRLARAGSVFAVLGVIGLLAVAIAEPVHGADEPPAWFAPVLILYIVGYPLSFLLFGTASLRTNTVSRSVGSILILVFISSLFFFHLIPLPVEGLLVEIPAFIIGVGLAAAGYLLLGESTANRGNEASTEAAAR